MLANPIDKIEIIEAVTIIEILGIEEITVVAIIEDKILEGKITEAGKIDLKATIDKVIIAGNKVVKDLLITVVAIIDKVITVTMTIDLKIIETLIEIMIDKVKDLAIDHLHQTKVI